MGLYLDGLHTHNFPPLAPSHHLLLVLLISGLELGRGGDGKNEAQTRTVPFAYRHPAADAGTTFIHGRGRGPCPKVVPQDPAVKSQCRGEWKTEDRFQQGKDSLVFSRTDAKNNTLIALGPEA